MPDIAWIKQNSSFNTADEEAISTDISVHSDRVYVVYSTTGTVQGQSKTSGEGDEDIVVMGMNKGNGTVRWIRQSPDFNGSTAQTIPKIAADSTGIYVTYAMKGGTIPGGVNPDNKIAIVVMKMDQDGNRQWIKQFNLNNNSDVENFRERYQNIAVNSVGAYITYSKKTNDEPDGDNDIVVMGINKNNGNVLWTKQDNTLNTTSKEGFPSIAADLDGLYLTYQTLGAVVGTNPGRTDLVVIRMNTAGVIQWRKQSNTFSNIELFIPILSNIAADSDGLYVTYTTYGDVIGQTVENENLFDIVVMRMKKTDGNVEWTKQNRTFNTADNDRFSFIAADSTGLYLVYNTEGTVPDETSTGASDIVVMRMNKLDGEVEWIRQNSTFNTIEDDIATTIAADSDGLYISYTTKGTVPDGTRAEDNTESYDIVVMKMNKPPPVCLLEGTLVRTPTGSVPIEQVKKDDYVLNQHYMPVRVVRTRQSTFEYKENPTTTYDLANVVYTLPAGTVGATSNVYLTKNHKFMTSDGTMKRPEEYGLQRSKLSEICKTKDLYTVYHLRLEDEYNNHFIVNGDCIVEDWYDWPRPKEL